MAERLDEISDDVELNGKRPTIGLRTYKSCIVLHTPGDAVWLTAKDARRLARSLVRMAERREAIDRQAKRRFGISRSRKAV